MKVHNMPLVIHLAPTWHPLGTQLCLHLWLHVPLQVLPLHVLLLVPAPVHRPWAEASSFLLNHYS